MPTQDFRLPGLGHRVAVVGRTGSGKTRFATWLLSHAAFDRQPYVVLDFKGDDLIGSISRAEEISLKTVPKLPGLYVLRALPGEEPQVEEWLWKIWRAENVGLYIDEMYLMPRNSAAVRAILTTGRSRRIPTIMLSQRPSLVPLHMFTEADFHSVFHLNFDEDLVRVRGYFDRNVDLRERQPEYHSRWYDVAKDASFIMKPVPGDDVTLERLHSRLKPRRRFL